MTEASIIPAVFVGLACGMTIGAWAGWRAFRRVLVEAGAMQGELEAEVGRLESYTEDLEGRVAELQTFVPDVEDSSAWSTTTPNFEHSGQEARINEALTHVLAFGDRLRRCAVCRAPAMVTTPTNYEWDGDQVWVELAEDCQACGAALGFRVKSTSWACMEAMRAWEGCRTAAALFKSEASASIDDDLKELDS